ncbi:MAG: RagB/SusD family nutrient uptake outer membrane protein, partial [Gemmatimonadota bacterium]
MRRLGSLSRLVGAALSGALLVGACANPFDTDVDNPNAVVGEALGDAAGATSLVNGLGASVTRALTGIYGPYHTATDELTWVGSREFWKNLDDGDVSDPINEYTDGAFPFVSEARWLADFTVRRVGEFATAGTLRNPKDRVRAHIYAAVIYITIGDMFEDFVLGSDRTVAADPVGPANMGVTYDSAVAMLDRALPIAVSTADAELQRQVLGLRARAKHGKAIRAKAKATSGSPLVADAGATADAKAALALMTPTWRFRLTPTANNLAGINVGFEMNNRGELRAGNTFVNADPARPIVPLAGIAGIKMLDPVTGVASTTVAAAIDACCRAAVGNLSPMTQVSAREMMLIVAEAELAAGNTANFLTEINKSRAVDALPAYAAVTNGTTMLEYERRVQLYFQGRRLADMYRFGVADGRWLTGNGVRAKCFLPITYLERLT